MSARKRQRLVKALLTLLVAGGLIAINGPTLVSAGKNALHEYKINSQGYKERNGHWSILAVPEKLRVNAIHAALLRTGKVLIVAGSGNDRKQFDAGKFHTILWDPATDKFKRIHTPTRRVLRRSRLPAGRQAADRRRHQALREAEGGRHLRGGRDDGQERVARRRADHAREGDRVPRARRAGVPQHEEGRRQAGRQDDRGQRGDERQGERDGGLGRGGREGRRVGGRPAHAVHDQRHASRQRRRVRVRDLADARQAGLLGRRQVVPVRSSDREVRARGQHDARALVPDAGRAEGRARAVGVGSRRVRPHHQGRQRDLRPRDQAVGGPAAAEADLPDLSRRCS